MVVTELAPARRALQAGLRHVPRREGLHGHQDARRLLAARSMDPDVPGADVHRGRHERRHQGEGAAGASSTATTTRCCSSPRSTRPASTSRCCTRCTWTSGSPACRPCRPSRASTAPRRARRTPSSSTSSTTPRRSTRSFQPYYEAAEVGERATPSSSTRSAARARRCPDLPPRRGRGLLQVFFAPKASQSPGDHAKLNAWLDKAVQRFKERGQDEHGAEEWRSSAAG